MLAFVHVNILLGHWSLVKPGSPEGTEAAVAADLLADLHSNVVQKQSGDKV